MKTDGLRNWQLYNKWGNQFHTLGRVAAYSETSALELARKAQKAAKMRGSVVALDVTSETEHKHTTR
jgi:hypothetical protein